MSEGAVSRVEHIARRVRSVPSGLFGAAFAAVLTGYVLGYPLSLVRYPPVIDLPFHAAQTSILAHYFDPAWHFREQFSIHPIELPYVSMYGIGCLLMQVAPPHIAAKGMVVAMLALVPAGLAVMFWGMRKSPLLGLLGLALSWNTLTHWGFLNFLGAIGLMAAAIGFALRALDQPSRSAQIALASCLVAVFFTHIYRVPFAILGVLATAVVMYPATKRLRPVLAPLAPVTILLVAWQFVRDRTLMGEDFELTFDLARLEELPRHLFGAYAPPFGAPPTPLSELENRLALETFVALGSMLAIGLWALVGDRDTASSNRGARVFNRQAMLLSLLLAAGALLSYLVLPFEVGKWFYVYPREAVTAACFALGAIPDLPRRGSLRIAALMVIALAPVRTTRFVATEYLRFERLTEDFREAAALIPPAPKLFYLVYELRGTLRRVSPFLHLPAWIQAEKGGWLNFHFVRWNHSLIRYREGDGSTPPVLPERFEWTPQHFRMDQHGGWFDTFLVRHTIDPSVLFGPDPTVELVAQRGTWWLYRRRAARK
jgi:hypothetical protein